MKEKLEQLENLLNEIEGIIEKEIGFYSFAKH